MNTLNKNISVVNGALTLLQSQHEVIQKNPRSFSTYTRMMRLFDLYRGMCAEVAKVDVELAEAYMTSGEDLLVEAYTTLDLLYKDVGFIGKAYSTLYGEIYVTSIGIEKTSTTESIILYGLMQDGDTDKSCLSFLSIKDIQQYDSSLENIIMQTKAQYRLNNV